MNLFNHTTIPVLLHASDFLLLPFYDIRVKESRVSFEKKNSLVKL